MRILFLGDLMGRSGRSAVIDALPELRKSLKLDFVIVNGENSASGFGITSKIANQVLEAGADVISGGNHSFDQREIMSHMNAGTILRPLNYPEGTPGKGFGLYDAPRGKKILVVNAMARVFMNPLDCPFRAIDTVLKQYRLGNSLAAIVVDFHGEATSEKMAMGHYLDGRVSLVVGTHSHVPTADCQILPAGTGYQTDAGMCGDYNSVIGMKKEEPISRFLTKMNKERYSPADGEATICGTFIETDDQSGLTKRIEPLRIGPRLMEHIPQV
ncbi:TIGR00282 family metallophosphoesterase [Kordiimonas sp. SCSIO 12610]|uniref:TIGR00282 family metallophosphoesterase n=1 Tax=Kordiimonas sp. SCSIO 12610 TaxID=2829597 RepID=UPI002108BB2A|nr:TIGR00282 family metallophosphoesterase [Kordiimonas sp. SCSIO 12610]UTW54992.1 YmdB family metallophosphoesterase [Kordiimonas sp. SCSIO 12610]